MSRRRKQTMAEKQDAVSARQTTAVADKPGPLLPAKRRPRLLIATAALELAWIIFLAVLALFYT
jgi:hypothetical protein